MKFLVCTDGSERSMAVLPHAARLAKTAGAQLVLMRVLDERVDAAGVVSPKLEDAVAAVEREWKRSLESQLETAGLSGATVIAKRAWGKEVADAIRDTADETGAGLIALASRGAGAIRHALLGSVAMGVISRADVPVLTTGARVGSPGTGAGYHLLVTSDGSADSRSVFEGLRGLLSAGRIKVTLIEVVTPKPGETDIAAKWRATETLTALLKRLPDGVDADVEARVAPLGADIDAAISAAGRELGADAIAMATHGHSARRHLVAGSTALGVLANGELPVILVKSRPVD